ncbi:hypothetical protein [uncultured Aquimarina sp.]|uniref:hypothetical protein n=1 Tax=uncultured Aquimarina sp. TaxID=575652 RepID=UPI0026381874|nr:hypothetical protein [uncultured Aquimarina sp.]
MEAFKYLLVFIITLALVGYGIYALIRGLISKDKKAILVSLLFIIAPLISAYFYFLRTE